MRSRYVPRSLPPVVSSRKATRTHQPPPSTVAGRIRLSNAPMEVKPERSSEVFSVDQNPAYSLLELMRRVAFEAKRRYFVPCCGEKRSPICR